MLRDEEGYHMISEQVSHHPPISAFYSESLNQDFSFHGSIYPKLKFWAKSVEAEPKGTMTLELSKWVLFIWQNNMITFLLELEGHWGPQVQSDPWARQYPFPALSVQ